MRRLRLLFCAAALTAVGCSGLEPLTTQEALDRLNIASTKILANDGSLITNLHGEIDRDIVALKDFPQHLRDAVVAVEDTRFYGHAGIDIRSMARATLSNAKGSQADELQGGSTLSQQLTKNLYFPKPERTFRRKLEEAKLTFDLESRYEKDEILEMYLNTIYLGRGAYGFQAAAREYFRKSSTGLTLAESAFLAGLIHEPATYEFESTDGRAVIDSKRALGISRRALVLGRMATATYISEEQQSTANGEPLELEDRQDARWKYPYYMDFALRELGVLRNSRSEELDPRFNFLGATFDERSKSVYGGGLRIHTSLIPAMQSAAEAAIAEELPEDLEKLSGALTAVDTSNGFVRALVGGRNYYPEKCDSDNASSRGCKLGKVNLALGELGGGSGRQPGSSFKTLVLAAAANAGVSMGTFVDGAPFEHKYGGGQTWKIRNYEGSAGVVDVQQATAKSVNAAFAHLLIDGVGEGDALDGARRVAEMARALGIALPTAEELKAKCGDNYNQTGACTAADGVPAIALGAKETSTIEMAGAYAAIANDGIHHAPTAIVKITDATGTVLYDAADPEGTRALTEGAARAVTKVLTGVISGGTGTRAKIGRPAAGKTGTSQQWRDAWFVGYVPQLAAAVWIGNPIPTKSGLEDMVPRNGYPVRITGGSYPAKIWQSFMSKATKGMPVEEFKAAPKELFVPVGRPVQLTTVPDVVGLSQSAATTLLAGAGLGAAPSACEGGDRGHVVSQSPSAGTEIERGRSVTICVSGLLLDGEVPEFPFGDRPGQQNPGGPKAVPSVIGNSTARATTTLRGAGFDVSTVRECGPAGSETSRVYSQNPGGGSSAPSGSTVTIFVQAAGC